MSGEGWGFWLDDMQDCLAGDHGEWWAERAEQAAIDSAQGRTRGTWQEWRDIRQAERSPSERRPNLPACCVASGVGVCDVHGRPTP